MYKLKNYLIASSLAFVVLTGASVRVYALDEDARRLKTPHGDVAFEVVGQVTNPSPTSSHQYGYLSLIRGLRADQIFTTSNPAAQNEATALFTFFTEATTQRIIQNGRLRVINRVGTTTIYFNGVPHGTFANPDSFRDGTPVMVMDYRQQAILDTGEGGTFTVMNLNAVTSSARFSLGDESFRLGGRGDQYRVFYSGAPPTPAPPPNGVFAGYAVAIEPAEHAPDR